MFSYVRLSDGGPPRFAGPRSEVSILSAIGRDLLADKNHVDWSQLSNHAAIRKLIADLIPDYAAVSTIDETRQEFHLPGRTMEEYRFPTPSGKARFHALPLPESPSDGNGQIRLMTIRSEGQFNTVVYDEEDLYRGQERRDVILMNADDIQRLGLTVDQRVRVRSEIGEMRYLLVRPFAIRAGNALMYYPEANLLVPKAVDPLSKTPAFKSIAITVEAEDTSAKLEVVGQAASLPL
jgi:anaerobic selenocysteine-containing dehydrogenase